MERDENIFKTYRDLGLKILTELSEELVCFCMFCGKDKLYVNKDTGRFDCKVCGASGNKYTYMRLFYTHYLNETTDKHYSILSGFRDKIPGEAFSDAKLAYIKATKEWIIPMHNTDGAIVNLRIWNRDTNIAKFLSACRATIYGEEILPNYSKIYMCEGEWDSIALRWVLKSCGIEDIGVVCCPGCQTFKDIWLPLFNGKDVTFLYDNDVDGQRGMKNAIKKLLKWNKTKSIQKLTWPEGIRDKYDVRDLIVDNLRNVKAIPERLECFFSDPDSEEKPDYKEVKKTSFESVIKDYERLICMTDDIKDGLLLLFSTIISNKMKDVPLWMYIIGPAGGGKSMILQSVADSEHSVYVSTLTPKTLVSGFKAGEDDPSLLPKLIGKTLIMKEYTEVLALSAGDQDKICGTFRGAFDGRVDYPFGNGHTRTYPVPGSGHDTCHFTFLAGVTNVIHGNNRAALGERFLKYQMFEDDYDSTDILEASVANILKSEIPETELKKSATAFLNHLFNRPFTLPNVPREYQKKIISLAQIVAIVRAHVERNGAKELVYRPVAEVGSRLVKQFVKLIQCVGFVLGKKEVDDECYRVVRKVALHTCCGWNRDAIFHIGKHPEGCTVESIAEGAKMSVNQANLCVGDLLELKGIVYDKVKNVGVVGSTKHWKLSPKMKQLFVDAELTKDVTINFLPKKPVDYAKTVKKRVKSFEKNNVAKTTTYS